MGANLFFSWQVRSPSPTSCLILSILWRHTPSRYFAASSNKRKGGREPTCFFLVSLLPFSHLLSDLFDFVGSHAVALPRSKFKQEKGRMGANLFFFLEPVKNGSTAAWTVSVPIRTMGSRYGYEPGSGGRDVAVGVESGEQSKEAQ